MTLTQSAPREDAIPMGRAASPAPSSKGLRRTPFRRLLSPGRGVQLARVALLVAVLGLWQLLSDLGVLDRLIFSDPVDVLTTLAKMLAGEQIERAVIYPHIWTTVSEMAIGYAVGSTVSVLVGIALARSRTVGQVVEPFILAWYGIPIITIAPLLVLVFGIGFGSKAATAYLGTFFAVFFQTYSGVMSLKEEYFLLARLMGASQLDLMRRVLIPGSLPFIFVGLRQAVPVAMTGAIVGEFVASSAGLGAFILNASASFDPAAAFAGLLIVIAVVTTFGQVVRWAEGLAIRWRPTAR